MELYLMPINLSRILDLSAMTASRALDGSRPETSAMALIHDSSASNPTGAPSGERITLAPWDA